MILKLHNVYHRTWMLFLQLVDMLHHFGKKTQLILSSFHIGCGTLLDLVLRGQKTTTLSAYNLLVFRSRVNHTVEY